MSGSEAFQDGDFSTVLAHDLNDRGTGSSGDFPQTRRLAPILDSRLASHPQDPHYCDLHKRSRLSEISAK